MIVLGKKIRSSVEGYTMNVLQKFSLTVLMSVIAMSGYAFTIQKVKVEGNVRLSAGAVRHILDQTMIQGTVFTTQKGQAIINKLFSTGDFSYIQLAQAGEALVIKVKENPILGKIKITGNKELERKKLAPILKQLDIIEGRCYNPNKLNDFKQGLIATYQTLGYGKVKVQYLIQKEAFNTVFLEIKVQEGKPTKVGSIKFIGNHVFKCSILQKQFSLTTPSLFTFLTHKDRYSAGQLEQDVISLREFYHDHGYLDFQIDKQQVVFHGGTEEKANITLFLSEGMPYSIGSIKIKGAFSQQKSVQDRVHTLRIGSIFSSNQLRKVQHDIETYLGNLGYAFARAAWLPVTDKKHHTVYLVMQINTGPKMYVRYIHILGNHYTTEEVVRKRLRQLEGSLYSKSQIDESSRRIANIGYLREKTPVKSSVVSGKPNQIDLTYQVEELNAGVASLQGGYSGTDGFTYGANVSQPNFMGTGRYVALGFQNSAYAHQYNFSYSNPFYTLSGMSRGVEVYYTRTTPEDVRLDSYTMNSYGVNWRYSIPVSDYNQVDFGYGYAYVEINNVNPEMISPGAYAFLQKYPGPYSTFSVTTGVTHSTLNRAIFPSSGNIQSLSAIIGLPLLKKSLAYYKVDYSGRWYWFLPKARYGINPHFSMGYGEGYSKQNGVFPFFLNYYGGGINSLPGYESNSLGPNNIHQTENAIGGNLSIFGGLNFVFPSGLSQNFRSAVFVDFGNIFQTHTSAESKTEKFTFDNLRWSTGLMLSWRAPFGLISFSYAVPFKTKPGDHLQQIGFSIGSSL